PGLAGLLTLGGVAAVFGATSPVGTAVLLSKSGGLPPTPPTCLITGPGGGCNAGVPGSCSIPNDGNCVGSAGAFSSEPSALANGFSWRASPFTFVYRTTPSRAKNEQVINKPNLVSRVILPLLSLPPCRPQLGAARPRVALNLLRSGLDGLGR